MDVFARRQIHDGVGAPTGGPSHFCHFFINRRAQSRVANVGIDLYQEIAPDNHRLGFWVVDVVGDDGAASGHFLSYKFRRDVGRYHRAQRLACVLLLQDLIAHLVAVHVFAYGDEFHFRRDDALFGVMHLGDVFACLSAAWLAYVFKANAIQFIVGQAFTAISRRLCVQLLSVATRVYPSGAQSRQALVQINADFGVGVSA